MKQDYSTSNVGAGLTIAQTEDLYARFLELERASMSVVPAFRMENGNNLWPVLKRRYFSDYMWTRNQVPIYGDPFSWRDAPLETWAIDRNMLRVISTIPKGQAFFFTKKSVHCRTVQGKLYDPYLDPIVSEVAMKGLQPLKFQTHAGLMGDCFYPPLEFALQSRKSILHTDKLPAIQGYAEYAEHSIEKGAPTIPQALIQSDALEIESYANVFSEILKRIQPKFVFLICYYTKIHMGLALACRSLGIPCVEYQHGMQCNHFMYTFYNMPKWGMETVPRLFFSWGVRPALHLRRMFSEQKYHKVVVAGKPEFIAWSKGEVFDNPQDIAALQRRLTGKKGILVPLMLSIERDVLAALRDLILNSPPNWVWLLRNHPLRKSNELQLPLDLPCVETELTTKLMLENVLSLSDHVVSGCSSVSLDAFYSHGIPVVLLGDNAARFFDEFIQPGMMQLAKTREEIHDAIVAGKKNPHPEKIENSYILHDTRLIGYQLQALMRA